MFQVKICGVTSLGDARAAAEAGADAVGFNFWPASPRYIRPSQAADIGRALPRDVARVGVFVDASPDLIRTTVVEAGLTHVQLHGDEPPAILDDLPWPSLRVLRPTREWLEEAAQTVRHWEAASRTGIAFLIDAACGARRGGTGIQADWKAARTLIAQFPRTTWILAGGLTPENVVEAIRAVGPSGVDVASGVEDAPGRKNHAAVKDFVRHAKAALADARKT